MNPKRLMKFPVGVVSVVVDDDDRDEMGNPRETTTTADYVGYYWQSRTDEDTANAEIVTDHYGLVLEAAAEGLVHAGDRITIGPLTFSVDGEPWPAVNPRTGALEYVQMKIVRTD